MQNKKYKYKNETWGIEFLSFRKNEGGISY